MSGNLSHTKSLLCRGSLDHSQYRDEFYLSIVEWYLIIKSSTISMHCVTIFL